MFTFEQWKEKINKLYPLNEESDEKYEYVKSIIPSCAIKQWNEIFLILIAYELGLEEGKALEKENNEMEKVMDEWAK
jgi:hypothetical protein